MDQPRRAIRDSLMLFATMRLTDHAEPFRIKVRNLSKGGMMAETPVHAVIGEHLTVELRNIGWINGTVAWVADSRFGVLFDREIDCKLVRALEPAPPPEMDIRGPVPKARPRRPGVRPAALRRI